LYFFLLLSFCHAQLVWGSFTPHNLKYLWPGKGLPVEERAFLDAAVIGTGLSWVPMGSQSSVFEYGQVYVQKGLQGASRLVLFHLNMTGKRGYITLKITPRSPALTIRRHLRYKKNRSILTPMTLATATEYLRQGVNLLLVLCLPIIGSGLAIGLLISLFQAVTQIQEQTLTFVPKLIIVFVVLSLTFPWMTSSIIAWTLTMWTQIYRF
jgi:flagellar biosynthetic protein FliQ